MVTFYHTVRFKSVCQAYYLFIYTYPSMNRIISDYIYPSVYTHLSVYRCDHVSTPTYLFVYLSIYISIYPSTQIYLSVCVFIFPHPSIYFYLSIYLTLTPMRLCMSVYPFINISSCLSMYHSTMYLCTHPLPIYLCIRPSIHPSRHRPNNPFLCVLSMHPHQCTYSPLRVCLSISIGSSPATHAPDDKHRQRN